MRENDDIVIIHTVEPQMFIQVHHEAIAMGEEWTFLTVNWENSDGVIETITLQLHSLLICAPEIDQELKDKVVKVLSRAWRWYRSYLEWEDKQIDDWNDQD